MLSVKSAILAATLLCSCTDATVRTVATFNIRWASPNDGPNSWVYRQQTVIDTLRNINADLVGLQEVTDAQHDDLCDALCADYEFFAAGELRVLVRHGISVTDTQVLPLASNDGRHLMWLCIDNQFTFAVTHAAGDARSLQQIRAALPTKQAILVGDFNALPGPNPWLPEQQSVFTADRTWQDVYAAVVPLHERQSSGCGWGECGQYTAGVDARIDWVLATTDWLPIAAQTWLRYTPTGGNVSDHWPVSGNVKLR